MSDDKLQDKIQRGKKAEQLMADPLFSEAFETLDRDYTSAWKATAVRDDDARERLWNAIQVLGKVKEHFGRVVADGRLAQSDVDRLNEKQPLRAV